MKLEKLAFDRASVRRFDVDGRMHVEISNISKACISPYYGREIPNCEGLGLSPDKVYQLYRDPEELRAAVHTFNGLPLLNKHIPVTAAAPQKQHIVGTTGTSAAFDGTYLTNGLVLWDASAIAGVQTEEQEELSSAYHYVADMTPGKADGADYDGRMTKIVGNHVALVEVGRAGPDVVVGDSQPVEFSIMKMSKAAAAVRAALGVYLKPKLAMDGKTFDVLPLIRDTKGKLKDKKAMVTDLIAGAKAKLAADMELDATELGELISMAVEGVEDEAIEPASDLVEDDGELCEQVVSMLSGKIPEEALAQIKAIIAGGGDQASDDEAPKPDDKKDDDKVDKTAMDAALKRARTETIEHMNAIRIAEEEVRSVIGSVVAQDSATAVYKLALDAVGVDLTGVPAAAYPALVRMHKQAQAPKPRIALDAAAEESFSTRFPTAGKLKRG